MTPGRFWEAIASLGGVADDTACELLDATLRERGEAEAFADHVDQHVDRLVARCRWPREVHGSDTTSWVAAAVVAAGRAAYEAVLARGEVDLDQWEWADAEALLVIAAERTDGVDGAFGADVTSRPLEDHGAPVPPLMVTLQWLAIPSPAGVHVPDDDFPELVVDHGDDPAGGRTPVHDSDWVTARELLAADREVVARRERLRGLDLHLTVRPASRPGGPVDGYRPVGEPRTYRFDRGPASAVVLCVPALRFPEGGSRVDAYVRWVHHLLDSAEG